MGNTEHMSGYLLFREMYKYLRERGLKPHEIAECLGRSPSTLRRYMSAPGTKAAVKPTFEASDMLVKLVNMTTDHGRKVVTEDDHRIACEWFELSRTADFLSRRILAEIAGVDIYSVAWVGRTHPRFGIQPTADMVARARRRGLGPSTKGCLTPPTKRKAPSNDGAFYVHVSASEGTLSGETDIRR